MVVHEIVGIEKQNGTFNGNAYDNLKFQCLICADKKNANNDKLVGRKVEVVKMRAKDFDGGIKVGDCVVFFFDKFQNCIEYKKM